MEAWTDKENRDAMPNRSFSDRVGDAVEDLGDFFTDRVLPGTGTLAGRVWSGATSFASRVGWGYVDALTGEVTGLIDSLIGTEADPEPSRDFLRELTQGSIQGVGDFTYNMGSYIAPPSSGIQGYWDNPASQWLQDKTNDHSPFGWLKGSGGGTAGDPVNINPKSRPYGEDRGLNRPSGSKKRGTPFATKRRGGFAQAVRVPGETIVWQ